jgi:2-oxoisovalerate dehydrogenase E1 component
MKTAFLIRRTEETLLKLFRSGEIRGTLHTCIGQELSATSVISKLNPDDVVFSNHRGHGHFLAKTRDVQGLIAEIMGKSDGVCGGIGGSQHLHTDGFYSNGVQGGMAPIAVGIAFAKKQNKTESIAVVFIGDGTFGQGIIYETLNLASIWNLPILFVVENNHIAQSTLAVNTTAGSIKKRAESFDIGYKKANIWDRNELVKVSKDAVNEVREKSKPILFEIETCRLSAHSKGEDDFRDKAEIKKYQEIDPLNRYIKEYPESASKILNEVNDLIDDAVERARSSGDCDFNPEKPEFPPIQWITPEFKRESVVECLNRTFTRLFSENPRLMMLGEDIEDPYGGAFKVSRNLSDGFPDRVINTPISEQAITGFGTGLALSGKIPIIEIMFGDFLTLTLDQLLQHACKFREMYNRQVQVPLIIRTPMGGGRGYGPTHSQSIEKHFLGIPDLNVLALNSRISPELIYHSLVKNIISPTLVIENKVLYSKILKTESIPGFDILLSDELYPTLKISPIGITPDVTIFCYGGMLDIVEVAIQKAFDEYESLCEIICPTQISPPNPIPIFESVRKSKRLIIVEEGNGFSALGSEIVAQICEEGISLKTVKRISYDSIVPASFSRETELLPSALSILEKIIEVIK